MKYFLTAFFCLASFSTVFAQIDYIGETEKWRAEHEKEISADDGWFTLAGLFWLKDGVNTVGAGEEFDVQLTKNFSGKFGEISFYDGKATLKLENAVKALADGKPFSSIDLVSDAPPQKPTKISIGSQIFYLIKREERFGIRLKDKESVARKNFKGLHWFPIDKKLRVIAKFEPFAQPKEILIPNMIGGNFTMKSEGILRFKLSGKEYTLQPVEDSGKFFIVFRDLTSKTETYSVGRFLYAEKSADGKVILDFNRAENPPCAYTTFATCPIPPKQNRLNIAIKGGEKRYGDH